MADRLEYAQREMKRCDDLQILLQVYLHQHAEKHQRPEVVHVHGGLSDKLEKAVALRYSHGPIYSESLEVMS
jgi:hypothetical protein